MNQQPAKPSGVNGRVVVAVLLAVVLVVSVYAVMRISESTDSSEPPLVESKATDLQPRGPVGGMPAYQMTPEDLENLRAKGLAEPIKDILADLEDQTELIPVQKGADSRPVFVPEQSRVVSPSRVLAYYTDGSASGKLLLEYTVNDGEIAWQVLEHHPN